MTASNVARELLERARNPDGGFGPRPGAPSEPEPTALGAIALDDADARAWLVANQRDDGSFGIVDGFVRDEAATGLAILALDDGEPRERALDRLEILEGEHIAFDPSTPMDGDIPAWPWTDDTFTWVEPTSRAMLALKRYRPTSSRIVEGIEMLRDRRSVGGGWNYGNRVVLGEDLPPFAHTTAIAVLAVRGIDPDLEREGSERLRGLWRAERTGAISLALSRAVYALADEGDEVRAIDDALEEASATTDLLLDDSVAAGWIAIATGPRLRRAVP